MFTDKKDFTRVWRGSPWKIAGQQVLTTNWIPNFDPPTAFIARLLVWVMLLGLLLEYWEQKYMHNILLPLGTLLRLDEVTRAEGRTTNRAMFARTLVELDLTKDSIEGVYIKSPDSVRFQKFAIENPPMKWDMCLKFLVQDYCNFCRQRYIAKGKQPLAAEEETGPKGDTVGDIEAATSLDKWITVPTRGQGRRW